MESIVNLNDQTIRALNELAIALRDSQVGLTEVAGKVSDKTIVKLFYEIAAERAQMEQELNHYIRVNEAEPPDATSFIGGLRHAWTMIRAALSGGDACVVLNEVEKSEAMIVDHYKRLLPHVAGNPLNKLLLEQFEKVKKGHTAVNELRKQQKPT